MSDPQPGWAVIDCGIDTHIVPLDDLCEHALDLECWCDPEQDEDDSGLLVHHSMDGREAHEEGKPLH